MGTGPAREGNGLYPKVATESRHHVKIGNGRVHRNCILKVKDNGRRAAYKVELD